MKSPIIYTVWNCPERDYSVQMATQKDIDKHLKVHQVVSRKERRPKYA